MRTEIVEKRLASIQNLSRQGKRINGLFRLMTCPALWEQAHEDIAVNNGALTPGVDPDNTLDGFSLARVDRIITAVMNGTYRFAPARRHYIPKPDGRKRPLGIPTADDKLVQAVVKNLLECIFEPIFSDQSHGFRQRRSCHTALEHIKYGWTGVKWLVEVDISSFFDNVDHDILLNLLRKRIDDERFIRLIHRMLKAGYMENWTFHKTFSGTPQGGVISPMLSNIYLHELDEHMAKMKLGFDKGQERGHNPEYKNLSTKIYSRRVKIKRRRQAGKQDQIPELLAEITALEKERLTVPSRDWLDPDYRRLLYCRYADDFLIGIIGGKRDAAAVMQEVQNFLKITLRLDTSPTKSGIRKADLDTPFLGYCVRTHTRLDTQRLKISGRITHARKAGSRVQIHAPLAKLAGFAERHHLGSFYMGRGEHKVEWIDYSDLEIIAKYNALMRGLAQYYSLGTSWRSEIGRLHHIWWWSLMKTLARKHKCSVAKIVRKLRTQGGYGLWYEGKNGKRFMRVFAIKQLKNRMKASTDVDAMPNIYLSERSDLLDRLHAKTCEACGNDNVPVEIHHARRLKDVQHRTLGVRVRAARTRKRIVLCVPCHRAHHAGRLQARLDAKVEAG